MHYGKVAQNFILCQNTEKKIFHPSNHLSNRQTGHIWYRHTMEKLLGIVFRVEIHIKHDFFTIATAKRAIFGLDELRESCLEFDFESKYTVNMIFFLP